MTVEEVHTHYLQPENKLIYRSKNYTQEFSIEYDKKRTDYLFVRFNIEFIFKY